MTSPTLERADVLPLSVGLARLAAEVRLVRQRPRPQAARDDGLRGLFEAELRLGIEAADPERAYAAAVALWRRSDEPLLAHAAVSRALAQAGAACAEGRCDVTTANRMAAVAAGVLHRLRAVARPAGAGETRGRVVLAVPPGEAHVLALQSLAHLLEAAGWTADVVGGLPATELARAARRASAVVLSVHEAGRQVDGLVAEVRRCAPDALIAVGGPAAAAAGADLVTSDPRVLLRALEARRCPLSARERDILQCVADGLTDAEAADALDVAPGTLTTHLDRILDKTGAPGRAAAVALGLRRGWIV